MAGTARAPAGQKLKSYVLGQTDQPQPAPPGPRPQTSGAISLPEGALRGQVLKLGAGMPDLKGVATRAG